MRFSLVVMTYDRPLGLRRCLDSLARLRAPEDGFEVIVVDDGSSTLEAERVAAEFASTLRIRFHRTEHRGVAAARNAGLALSRGAIIGFLADDYTLPPEYLEAASGFLREHPEAQVLTFNIRSCGTSLARHVQQLYVELVLLQNANADPDRDGVIRTLTLPASRAALFRREVFERVGAFDESMTSGEDGEMGLRLADHGIAQCFLTALYIEHWENKRWRDFMRQRTEYAKSTYALTRRRGEGSTVRRRWTLAACASAIARRVRPWARVSRRNGRFVRFVLLSPGLILFLARFFLTLRRCELEDVRRSG